MAYAVPYDLESSSFLAAPYPTWASVLAEQPVYHDPQTGEWFLTRYDDRVTGLHDQRLSSDRTEAWLSRIAPADRAHAAYYRRCAAP